MEAFHELKVNCPYEILEIENIKISNKPNEHGYLYLKVLVDESVNFKYAIEASTDDKICIYEETENQEKTIIFNGTIQNIRTSNVDRLYYMEIEALTSSFSLDIQEKSRSFQDIEMSYDDLIETILRDYKIYSFTQYMDKPQSIGKPLFQYKETDYEFLKRVASHLGLELICDTINENNVFYFGRPIGKAYELEEDIDYTASIDVKKYRESLVHNDDFHPTDFFYYEIKSKRVMEIGAKVTFKAKELYVNSYEAEYVRGELIFKYKLCRKKGIWQENLYNEKLNGISLEGKVMEVSGEQVKLHLNIDEAQNQSKAAWFRYAPPTGNLMYSMPIVGTNANLYFPSERSQDPMVIGCVRKNGGSCEKFSNVNNRYFSTESGNNLDMLPDSINFSRPGLSATFNDGGGVNLSSSSSLSVNAGYIGLFAGNISIEANSKLEAKKGGSSLSLEDEFYNDAGIVMENGSDRASNEPFDDDPQKGVSEAITSSMAAAMQAAIGAIAAAVQGAIGKIGDCLAGGAENQKGNVECEVNSSKSDEKSLLSSAIDFLTGAQPCYAAERENIVNNKEAESSNGKKDVDNLNDPLNLYGNKPWMNVDTNIKLPDNECYIGPANKNTIPLQDWQYDVLNMYDAPGEYKLQYFGDYLKDRWYRPAKEYFTMVGLAGGMDQTYAELYADFTIGSIFETGVTVLASGVKAANALISGKSLSEEQIIAGSGIGNITGQAKNSREIVLNTEKTHESGRNVLSNIIDDSGGFKNGSKPYIGRMESSYGYNKQIGRQSLDGKIRWRLDYDPEMGVHYNIEDFSMGKGAKSKKTVIPMDISYDEYKAIIDSMNNKVSI